MFDGKKALTLWLGLFFYILGTPPFLQAETEISAGTGTIWVEEDRAAGYWHGGFNIGSGENFSIGFNTGQIISNLPWMNGSVFGASEVLGFDTDRAGINLRAGLFHHEEFGFAIDKIELSSKGGSGFFAGAETPLHFGPFAAAPCFYYGKASWNDGDLYWFFGKPDISDFMAFGLSMWLEQKYTKAGKLRHGLTFRWSLTDMTILSNEDEPIFNANFNGGVLYYSISMEMGKNSFSAALGWLYAGTEIDGALTYTNQPYFLFPFRFYNIDASIDFHAGFAVSDWRHNIGIFSYDICLGLFHIFYDRGKVDIHYQMKKLFGEEEAHERIKPEFSGLGAAFLLLEGSIPAIRIGRRRLSLSLQKAFILPWGYEKLLTSITGADTGAQNPQKIDMLPLVKSALLSGLFFRASLNW